MRASVLHTCTKGGLAGPAPVCPAGPVFGAPSQVEARLAGVDEGVAQRRQLYRTHISLGRRLWLATVVGWREGGREERREERRKKKRGEVKTREEKEARRGERTEG